MRLPKDLKSIAVAVVILLFARQGFASYQCEEILQIFAFSNHRIQNKETLQNEMKANTKALNFNLFTVSRDVFDYHQEFSEHVNLENGKSVISWSFLQKLNELKSTDRWLDSGAGNAMAMKSFLKKRVSKKEDFPEMVALMFKRPLLTYLSSPEPIKFIAGRKLEQIPDEDLGTFNLITDFYGPMAYSENPMVILNQYLRLTRENGVILMKLDFFNTVIDSQTGQLKTLSEWLQNELKKNPFIEVDLVHKSVLRVSVRRKTDFQIRSLPLQFFKAGPPPARSFVD